MSKTYFYTIFISLAGLLIGIGFGIFFYHYSQSEVSTAKRVMFTPSETEISATESKKSRPEVIGFLPYWLLDKARDDYYGYITTLTYFGIIVETDGSIRKFENTVESEPGWYALHSGRLDSFLETALRKNILLSLLVFNGDPDEINELINHPEINARNLVDEVLPIMQEYGFSNLNLDIENVKNATDEERENFTRFIKAIDKELSKKSTATLTIDIAASDLIQKHSIDPAGIAPYVDSIVLMAYDYHYSGSYVTGPVAPLSGAGKISEYDIETAIQKMLEIIPAEKIRLGIPLYGYEWETINKVARSAVIPGSGITASSNRVEKLLADCQTCVSGREIEANEPYVIFADEDTGVNRQIFYPDEIAMKAKISYAQKQNLGGMALWAMGYESSVILEPLKDY